MWNTRFHWVGWKNLGYPSSDEGLRVSVFQEFKLGVPS